MCQSIHLPAARLFSAKTRLGQGVILVPTVVPGYSHLVGQLLLLLVKGSLPTSEQPGTMGLERPDLAPGLNHASLPILDFLHGRRQTPPLLDSQTALMLDEAFPHQQCVSGGRCPGWGLVACGILLSGQNAIQLRLFPVPLADGGMEFRLPLSLLETADFQNAL
jgi:hypothetical protein